LGAFAYNVMVIAGFSTIVFNGDPLLRPSVKRMA